MRMLSLPAPGAMTSGTAAVHGGRDSPTAADGDEASSAAPANNIPKLSSNVQAPQSSAASAASASSTSTAIVTSGAGGLQFIADVPHRLIRHHVRGTVVGAPALGAPFPLDVPDVLQSNAAAASAAAIRAAAAAESRLAADAAPSLPPSGILAGGSLPRLMFRGLGVRVPLPMTSALLKLLPRGDEATATGAGVQSIRDDDDDASQDGDDAIVSTNGDAVTTNAGDAVTTRNDETATHGHDGASGATETSARQATEDNCDPRAVDREGTAGTAATAEKTAVSGDDAADDAGKADGEAGTGAGAGAGAAAGGDVAALHKAGLHAGDRRKSSTQGRSAARSGALRGTPGATSGAAAAADDDDGSGGGVLSGSLSKILTPSERASYVAAALHPTDHNGVVDAAAAMPVPAITLVPLFDVRRVRVMPRSEPWLLLLYYCLTAFPWATLLVLNEASAGIFGAVLAPLFVGPTPSLTTAPRSVIAADAAANAVGAACAAGNCAAAFGASAAAAAASAASSYYPSASDTGLSPTAADAAAAAAFAAASAASAAAAAATATRVILCVVLLCRALSGVHTALHAGWVAVHCALALWPRPFLATPTAGIPQHLRVAAADGGDGWADGGVGWPKAPRPTAPAAEALAKGAAADAGVLMLANASHKSLSVPAALARSNKRAAGAASAVTAAAMSAELHITVEALDPVVNETEEWTEEAKEAALMMPLLAAVGGVGTATAPPVRLPIGYGVVAAAGARGRGSRGADDDDDDDYNDVNGARDGADDAADVVVTVGSPAAGASAGAATAAAAADRPGSPTHRSASASPSRRRLAAAAPTGPMWRPGKPRTCLVASSGLLQRRMRALAAAAAEEAMSHVAACVEEEDASLALKREVMRQGPRAALPIVEIRRLERADVVMPLAGGLTLPGRAGAGAGASGGGGAGAGAGAGAGPGRRGSAFSAAGAPAAGAAAGGGAVGPESEFAAPGLAPAPAPAPVATGGPPIADGIGARVLPVYAGGRGEGFAAPARAFRLPRDTAAIVATRPKPGADVGAAAAAEASGALAVVASLSGASSPVSGAATAGRRLSVRDTIESGPAGSPLAAARRASALSVSSKASRSSASKVGPLSPTTASSPIKAAGGAATALAGANSPAGVATSAAATAALAAAAPSTPAKAPVAAPAAAGGGESDLNAMVDDDDGDAVMASMGFGAGAAASGSGSGGAGGKAGARSCTRRFFSCAVDTAEWCSSTAAWAKPRIAAAAVKAVVAARRGAAAVAAGWRRVAAAWRTAVGLLLAAADGDVPWAVVGAFLFTCTNHGGLYGLRTKADGTVLRRRRTAAGAAGSGVADPFGLGPYLQRRRAFFSWSPAPAAARLRALLPSRGEKPATTPLAALRADEAAAANAAPATRTRKAARAASRAAVAAGRGALAALRGALAFTRAGVSHMMPSPRTLRDSDAVIGAVCGFRARRTCTIFAFAGALLALALLAAEVALAFAAVRLITASEAESVAAAGIQLPWRPFPAAGTNSLRTTAEDASTASGSQSAIPSVMWPPSVPAAAASAGSAAQSSSQTPADASLWAPHVAAWPFALPVTPWSSKVLASAASGSGSSATVAAVMPTGQTYGWASPLSSPEWEAAVLQGGWLASDFAGVASITLPLPPDELQALLLRAAQETTTAGVNAVAVATGDAATARAALAAAADAALGGRAAALLRSWRLSPPVVVAATAAAGHLSAAAQAEAAGLASEAGMAARPVAAPARASGAAASAAGAFGGAAAADDGDSMSATAWAFAYPVLLWMRNAANVSALIFATMTLLPVAFAVYGYVLGAALSLPLTMNVSLDDLPLPEFPEFPALPHDSADEGGRDASRAAGAGNWRAAMKARFQAGVRRLRLLSHLSKQQAGGAAMAGAVGLPAQLRADPITSAIPLPAALPLPVRVYYGELRASESSASLPCARRLGEGYRPRLGAFSGEAPLPSVVTAVLPATAPAAYVERAKAAAIAGELARVAKLGALPSGGGAGAIAAAATGASSAAAPLKPGAAGKAAAKVAAAAAAAAARERGDAPLTELEAELLLQAADDEDGSPALLELLAARAEEAGFVRPDGSIVGFGVGPAAGSAAAVAAAAAGGDDDDDEDDDSKRDSYGRAVPSSAPVPGVFAGFATPLLDCSARALRCVPGRLSHGRHFRMNPRPVAEASILLPACSAAETLALLTLLRPDTWLHRPVPGPAHLRKPLPATLPARAPTGFGDAASGTAAGAARSRSRGRRGTTSSIL